MITKSTRFYYFNRPGCLVPVPVGSDGTPDFSAFSEPTLSLLKADYANAASIGVAPEPVETVTVPQPDPESLLKYMFSGSDPNLTNLFLKVFGATFTNPVAAQWYSQLVHGSRPGLFVVSNPPSAGGFGLALNALCDSTGVTQEEKGLIRLALVKFGLPPGMLL